jgi:hypothetical protein
MAAQRQLWHPWSHFYTTRTHFPTHSKRSTSTFFRYLLSISCMSLNWAFGRHYWLI